MPTVSQETKETSIIQKLEKSFSITSDNVAYFKKVALNLDDFKNKVTIMKTGIAIDRFLFVNLNGDILEQGWDINIYNPGRANIDYKMHPEFDFVLNKKEPIEEDLTLSESERNEKLKKIYDKFFTASFLCIVWTQQRDSLIENKLFIFRPGEDETNYKQIMNNTEDDWSF